ncbi:MAG: SMC-Scp complex subunit ScpB [Phycisphaerales bacterium]|nr:SMC-Scp complex subunit ScpB [Phycisphaerales bacterium]
MNEPAVDIVQLQESASASGSPSSPASAPDPDVRTIVEALLFATDRPLPASRIAQILGFGDAGDVKEHVAALNRRYEETGAAFRIEAIARGYQMMTQPAFDRWVAQLLQARKDFRLSPAALETLAVVAYKQPCMRAEIDSIRGVVSGEVLARLREMNLVKIVGRAEELGRPLLYGTTGKFLEVFGLASLKDLPKADALTPPAQQPRAEIEPVVAPGEVAPSERASSTA